ncbi:unnamed protein product [Angiostrongylus costaricensis]|uniref:Uncharacterized protein n=1 Tax=Angiostrongylus costaricensis TaxID=334426 RepID=A0A0R3Q299_ANGCS|nr:unnamed protein product [Angiostrongylus costaricensis]
MICALQCKYTCIRVLDGRLDHASEKDKVRGHRPRRDESTPLIQRRLTPEKNCSSEHATVDESVASAFSSTPV